MEASDLEQRIRAMQSIVMAAAESEEDYCPLLDTLIPAAEFMTREELLEELKRVCAAFDRQALDAITERRQSRQEKENMQRELDASRLDNAALKSDNDRLQKSVDTKDAEIKALKARLADTRHSEESLKQEKFAGKSKRGLGKTKTTEKGRDDDKDDFDGTGDSASQYEGEENRSNSSDKAMKLDDIRRIRKARPKSYTLADAAIKEIHDCDMSMVPAGARIIGESIETVFDEKRVIKADIYKFVTYEIQEEIIDEDGNTVMVKRQHTMHFPKRKGNPSSQNPPVPMMRGHLPNQVPGTHETPSMLANLLFEHYQNNVAMNRISTGFKNFGFNVRRSTLEGLDSRVAAMLRPLYDALLDDILCDDAVIFCDETWQRLKVKQGMVSVTRKVYDWIIGNRKKKAVAYKYDDGSRGRKVIASILENRHVKAIHTDGYNAYYFLQGIGIVHIGCGAHLWRYIKEWYERTHDPEALALLLDLRELFGMEAQLRENHANPEEVLKQRNSPKTLDIISRFTARVELLLEKCKEIPKVGYRALNYAREMASKVFRWREDADYALDNNFAEQSARPIATSRKVSFFHCSHKAAENDCIIRSFFETCHLREVSPVAWFTEVFLAMINGRTDYPNLLPGVLPIK